MMEGRFAFAGFFALGAVSCAPSSDTPAGFEAKTGVKLCSTAMVEHINRDDPSRTVGFDEFYFTRVKMSEACARDLYGQLAALSNQRCDFASSCQVRTDYGLVISVVRTGADYYSIQAVG